MGLRKANHTHPYPLKKSTTPGKKMHEKRNHTLDIGRRVDRADQIGWKGFGLGWRDAIRWICRNRGQAAWPRGDVQGVTSPAHMPFLLRAMEGVVMPSASSDDACDRA
jgi:hypothetical protein